MPQNWKPENQIAKTVYTAGFSYDPDQDIIYSRMNAWQRQFGYAYLYDLAAPAGISAVIDCEPIFFKYKKKDWMIELWKGQYGLETGAEAGIYVVKRPYLHPLLGIRPHDLKNSKFFDCAGDGERLTMSFNLKRNGEIVFSRGPDLHWWLTGFKWGVLSKPEDLTMELYIRFADPGMCRAFSAALQQTGYQNITMNADSVSFVFGKPFTYQPRHDPLCKNFVDSAEKNNKQLVDFYRQLNLKNNDPNEMPDDVAGNVADYFAKYSPLSLKDNLSKILLDMGKNFSDFEKPVSKFFSGSLNPFSRIISAITGFFRNLFG